jgi:hypothetical protein
MTQLARISVAGINNQGDQDKAGRLLKQSLQPILGEFTVVWNGPPKNAGHIEVFVSGVQDCSGDKKLELCSAIKGAIGFYSRHEASVVVA